MRFLTSILILLAATLQLVAQEIPTITAIEADRIGRSLPTNSISTQVYDLKGVIVGINRAQDGASFIKAEMEMGGDEALAIYRLASFDSLPFLTRDVIDYGDTVVIRTRLSNFNDLPTSHYGYLLSVRKFVDPVPELIASSADKEWRLIAEAEKRNGILRNLKVVATLFLLLLAFLAAGIIWLKHRSEHDSLTKILNRFGGERILNKTLQGRSSGFFAVMDMDNFREVNEKHGNLEGDQVLIRFAQLLKNEFKGDIVMRMGGDEFAIFVKDISEEEFNTRIEQFFAHVQEIPIEDETDFKLCVSMGVTHHNGLFLSTLDQLYIQADKGLYLSKKHAGSYVTFVQ